MAVAVVAAIVLAGTGGVYAAKNYIFDIMNSISDTEKEKLCKSGQQSGCGCGFLFARADR